MSDRQDLDHDLLIYLSDLSDLDYDLSCLSVRSTWSRPWYAVRYMWFRSWSIWSICPIYCNYTMIYPSDLSDLYMIYMFDISHLDHDQISVRSIRSNLYVRSILFERSEFLIHTPQKKICASARPKTSARIIILVLVWIRVCSTNLGFSVGYVLAYVCTWYVLCAMYLVSAGRPQYGTRHVRTI